MSRAERTWKKKGEKIEIMGEFEFLQKTRIIMERVI